MSALVLTLTDAGRAALVNAQHDGTATAHITQIGFTDVAFAADKTMLVVPAETRRLTSVGGETLSADTLAVSVSDTGPGTYAVRGFGVYFDDGTLFALYGQADPIVEKAAVAVLLLSFSAKFIDADVSVVTFGAISFGSPPATTERQGIVELATAEETIAGVDPDRAVTPAGLKAATDQLAENLSVAATTEQQGIVELATAAETIAGVDPDRAVTPASLKAATDRLAIRWASAAAGAQLVAGTHIIPDNTAGAITLHLPAVPQDGDAIEWRQGATSFAANPVTFDPGVATIMGLAESMTVDTVAAGGSLVWRAALNTWRVYATNTAGTNP